MDEDEGERKDGFRESEEISPSRYSFRCFLESDSCERYDRSHGMCSTDGSAVTKERLSEDHDEEKMEVEVEPWGHPSMVAQGVVDGGQGLFECSALSSGEHWPRLRREGKHRRNKDQTGRMTRESSLSRLLRSSLRPQRLSRNRRMLQDGDEAHEVTRRRVNPC